MPFDPDLYVTYGDLLDKLDRLADKYNANDEDRHRMFGLADLATLIDIMIHEACGDTCMTESIVDEAYGSMPVGMRDDFIEELVNFHNCGIVPLAMNYLVDVHKSMDGIILTAMTPMREDDTLIYTFTRCYDD